MAVTWDRRMSRCGGESLNQEERFVSPVRGGVDLAVDLPGPIRRFQVAFFLQALTETRFCEDV